MSSLKYAYACASGLLRKNHVALYVYMLQVLWQTPFEKKLTRHKSCTSILKRSFFTIKSHHVAAK